MLKPLIFGALLLLNTAAFAKDDIIIDRFTSIVELSQREIYQGFKQWFLQGQPKSAIVYENELDSVIIVQHSFKESCPKLGKSCNEINAVKYEYLLTLIAREGGMRLKFSNIKASIIGKTGQVTKTVTLNDNEGLKGKDDFIEKLEGIFADQADQLKMEIRQTRSLLGR